MKEAKMKRFLFRVDEQCEPILISEISSDTSSQNFHHSKIKGEGMDYAIGDSGRIMEFVVEAENQELAKTKAKKQII